jgi:tetratricopeptide (TPR) repeat protein
VQDPIEPNAVPDPTLEREGAAPESAPPGPASDTSPLILIPVTAEDVARKGRRTKLIWVAALVAIVAMSAYVYKRAQDPRQAQESFDAGQRLFAVARYPQAILSFDRAITLMPGFEEALLMRGRSRVAQYENDQAIVDFTKAIEVKPGDTRALLDRGRAYLFNKKFELAITDASATLAIDSNLSAAYNLRGVARRELGNLMEALDDFNHAVTLAPNADNYYQRGATYQLLGQHKQAIDDFTATIEFLPDIAQGYFARAESERALGDDAAAKRDHLQGRILDGR